MSTTVLLKANRCIDATSLSLSHHDLPPEQALAGHARVGTLALGEFGECGIGVWEITPSVSTDVEADEVFVVLSGRAIVSFDDGSPELHLQAGVVARLQAGSRTTWKVTETLRKVYIV
jgi:uncharacterized protein